MIFELMGSVSNLRQGSLGFSWINRVDQGSIDAGQRRVIIRDEGFKWRGMATRERFALYILQPRVLLERRRAAHSATGLESASACLETWTHRDRIEGILKKVGPLKYSWLNDDGNHQRGGPEKEDGMKPCWDAADGPHGYSG